MEIQEGGLVILKPNYKEKFSQYSYQLMGVESIAGDIIKTSWLKGGIAYCMEIPRDLLWVVGVSPFEL